MMETRAAALRELGAAYSREGGPLGVLGGGRGEAPDVAAAIVRACPGWEDVRTWRGRRLCFRKRAQLCVAMIHGWTGGRGPGALRGLERLTAFADYRLPQVLRGSGILRLSDPLSRRIAAGEQLPMGSEDEVALRAATIAGAERLRAVLAARRPRVTALVVDHVLWRFAVAHQHTLPPFHRTRTTDY